MVGYGGEIVTAPESRLGRLRDYEILIFFVLAVLFALCLAAEQFVSSWQTGFVPLYECEAVKSSAAV